MTKVKFLVAITVLCFVASCNLKNEENKGFDEKWKTADTILSNIKSPVFPEKQFLLTNFGAKGDSITDCTEAFRKAIEACNAAGGGSVVVSEGVFLTGAIYLKSNVNLHLQNGSRIKFNTDPEKYLPVVLTRFEGVECYNFSPLIYALNEQNIAITGEGTLDGGAGEDNWWKWKGGKNRPDANNQIKDVDSLNTMSEKGVAVEKRIFGKGHFLRPNFIQPYKCKNILIQGVTIIRSPMWEIHPVLSENITVDDVKIFSHGPNNDGCDPESCKNVLIQNCLFDTGDDCIAIKSGRNADGRRVNVPSENIIVRGCTMKDGHGGVVIGSEISGSCRNVFIDSCIMDSPNLDRALRIKTNAMRGGIVENVLMKNVKVGEVKEAVVLVSFQYQEGDNGPFTPEVRNIYVKNVTSRKSKYALLLDGYQRSPVKNIYLENCKFDGVESENFIRNAENLHCKEVSINGKPFVFK
jgi:polygalacturonase